jgi:lipopolysaccharide export system permease protein
MIKKLDKLVIRAFIGPFIATFFITLMVLVLQFFWLYIDDFVGKGLGPGLIFEFIWYQMAVLVPLALPLSILLSSLMTFGNLGESFELVAIKSSGISLLRFMRPLFIVTVFVCGVAFMFSNYLMPVAQLKSRTLLADIVYAKPAFDLQEGVFYDRISGFAIKIGEKENDSIIRNVIVYEQSNSLQDNFIIAPEGRMRVTEDKRLLEFNLRNGWRYQERGQQGGNETEYIRLGFREYKKQFDLSSFQFNRTADSVNRNQEKMLSMRQLNQSIDSIKKEIKRIKTQQLAYHYSPYGFINNLDSNWKPYALPLRKARTFDDLLPDSAKQLVNEAALTNVSTLKINLESAAVDMWERERNLRKHKIEWHRKITLSLACLVLFLIGAPLGAIIRKGGLGTPLVFAIIFFMLFYFSSTMGEKFGKENKLPVTLGMWLSTLALVPVGLFLTWKAMHDSRLFNQEFYARLRKRLGSFAALWKPGKTASGNLTG